MANTTFIDGQTPIVASWLNDVNDFVYYNNPVLLPQGYVTATSGQTVFTVPFNYLVGSNKLKVYIDGVKQVVNLSYAETNTNTVTFTSGVHVGAIVEFTY